MAEQARDLIEKVKAAALARVRKPLTREARLVKRVSSLESDASRFTNDVSLATAMLKTTDTVIAIGASTGGTEAIRELLEALPPNTPPIMITQHMPEKFTRTFADRLNSLCRIAVKEAEDGDSLLTGRALIAPGNYHMTLARSGARYGVRLNQDPPVNRHRPSVDVMFDSVAHSAGSNSVGVLLTGMGADGARGLLAMKQAGAHTIAEDESSCVVFGMPKEAIKLGAVDRVVPLPDIAAQLLTSVGTR